MDGLVSVVGAVIVASAGDIIVLAVLFTAGRAVASGANIIAEAYVIPHG